MTRHPIATNTMTAFARGAAGLALTSAALFVVLLAALHILKPELDPSWRFISEYEIGDHGWIMRLAFVALAISCAALGVAVLSQIRTLPGYLGLVLLAPSAIGMVLAGIFVTDPVTVTGDARTASGRLHELGAMLDLVPFAGILINWSLARNPAWTSARRALFWTAGIPLIGTAVFVSSLAVMLPAHGGQLGPDVLIGWPNRIMILAQCAWLLPVAWCAMRLRGAEGGAPDSQANV